MKNPTLINPTLIRQRVGLVCDLLEERWTSMDLVANMLERGLRQLHPQPQVTRLCPPMNRRFSSPQPQESKTAFNADRLLNRFWDYPRWLRARRHQFDVFHVVDHSYAQLVHELPAEQTVVTCHDIDTFRSLFEQGQARRSVAFRSMIQRTLSGLQKASHVTCDSEATKQEVLTRGLLPAERVSVVPNGVHPSCSAEADPLADREAARLLGPTDGSEILHVGSTIPRKRMDVLLATFAGIMREFPTARLIQVGGMLTAEQGAQAQRLGIEDRIVVTPHLRQELVSSIYRRASVVLLPSEREGFGLPLVEAMACGAVVLASNLPVLREVGGEAASYCTVADVPAWTQKAIDLLYQSRDGPEQWQKRRTAGIARASQFTWQNYALRMARIYRQIAA